MEWSALQVVNAVIVSVGVPAIVASLIYIGRQLQTLETVRREVDQNIRPDLKDVRERFATLEGKTAELFQTKSPIGLTPKGQKYLQESGLKAYIDENKEGLMESCDPTQTMSTPYDVQQVAFEFFSEHDLPSDVEDKAKTYAFSHGISMEALRRTAGIHFRDIFLKARGFDSSDLE